MPTTLSTMHTICANSDHGHQDHCLQTTRHRRQETQQEALKHALEALRSAGLKHESFKRPPFNALLAHLLLRRLAPKTCRSSAAHQSTAPALSLHRRAAWH